MGTTEEQTPAKRSESVSSTQEIPTITTSYAEWTTSIQAYYGTGAPPPFFASPVASPAPHSYTWVGQHRTMSPYDTPVHYPALYQPGAGVYPHPILGTTNTVKSASGNEGASQSAESGSEGSCDGSDEDNTQHGLIQCRGNRWSRWVELILTWAWIFVIPPLLVELS